MVILRTVIGSTSHRTLYEKAKTHPLITAPYKCLLETVQAVRLRRGFITVHKRSLEQGKVFTPVCHSVQGWGVLLCIQGGLPPGEGPRPGGLLGGSACRRAPPAGQYRIWSTSGLCTSYWNAFLFTVASGLSGNQCNCSHCAIATTLNPIQNLTNEK